MIISVKKVSVPSRGAIFLNEKEEFVKSMRPIVSVPSRGAIFLNKRILYCT